MEAESPCRSLLGTRHWRAGCNLTGDGALPPAGAAWDRSLRRCAFAPWPHAHLGNDRERTRAEGEKEVFISDADDLVLAMTIKSSQIHPRLNKLGLFHHLKRF